MMMNAARSVRLLIEGTFNPLADVSSTWPPSFGSRRARRDRPELWADL
jgi:hypothetical protein